MNITAGLKNVRTTFGFMFLILFICHFFEPEPVTLDDSLDRMVYNLIMLFIGLIWLGLRAFFMKAEK